MRTDTKKREKEFFMGLFSKIKNAVSDVFDGATGWIVDPYKKIGEEITGVSPTDQMSAGGLAGSTMFLLNNALPELSGLGNVQTGLTGLGDSISKGLSSLSSLGNSFVSGLSSLGKSFASGLSGLGSNLLQPLEDYYNLKNQWKYQKEAMNLQDTFNKQAEQRQNQYNIQAENRAMQNNIKLWNMQNEYNTPAAQMQRLIDAKLNPNLAYGTANTTAGSISAPSSHGVTTRANKALQRQAFQLNYQQLVSNQLQNQLLMEQIADKRADRMLMLQQSPLDTAYKQAQIDAIKNGISVRNADIGLSYNKFNYEKDKPRSWIGNVFYDARKGWNAIRNWKGTGGVSAELF